VELNQNEKALPFKNPYEESEEAIFVSVPPEFLGKIFKIENGSFVIDRDLLKVPTHKLYYFNLYAVSQTYFRRKQQQHHKHLLLRVTTKTRTVKNGEMPAILCSPKPAICSRVSLQPISSL